MTIIAQTLKNRGRGNTSKFYETGSTLMTRQRCEKTIDQYLIWIQTQNF